ncbi:DUF3275 family protein [Gilliamella sp. B2776]|uniref:DUF3275 family protein n=1 Tax=unclassified Gilliamella TaxID=2685620 RepID=UPI00226A0F68|nr:MULTISPECIES: DUF3275 family protein [unclassified Gilliamella]MCX8578691.1 DUF3275 family protein [Gilliamella sp. B2717]MCX8649573.1 DUF3275 family protein [Gilliamella sp. B2779]MCX8653852.1 DUF3275 family protein [Gilliamella sp. B2737]MCX8691437.1 DUF3275 family protein [Gilliamella sp. B2776]MCX8702502.1 DUF3275 family protein [Gilliamella sp. B2781]
MISIPGELVITTRTGKYGNFNVAKLFTSIGEFSLKDNKLLDQYEAGKYEGSFVIKQIKSSSYSYGNRVVIECCAYIEDMDLVNSFNLDETDSEIIHISEDPICQRESSEVQKVNSEHQSEETMIIHSSGDAELFGFLWPIGDQVKLDSTEDRLKIRSQKKRLIELGYCFDYKSQCWNKLPEQF